MKNFPKNVSVTTVIQRMQPFHLDAVMEIEEDSFVYCWGRKEFETVAIMDDSSCVVLFVNDELLGYLCFQLLPFEEEMVLVNLAVKADHRRMGVGSFLVNTIVDTFPCKKVVVVASESNLVSLTFFRHLGFQATELLPDYYEGVDGMEGDAISMELLKKVPSPIAYAKTYPGEDWSN